MMTVVAHLEATSWAALRGNQTAETVFNVGWSMQSILKPFNRPFRLSLKE